MVLDLPLDAIAPDHLTRDRLPAEDAEMAALRASIRAHGQRTPIEVTPLEGAGALPYGLISGWRRLQALKALHAETGEARFATVQALVRRPETAADAYVDHGRGERDPPRAQPLRARPGRGARHRPRRLPEREGGAARALRHRLAPKRSRIRAFLEIYHALDGALALPRPPARAARPRAGRAGARRRAARGSPRPSPRPTPRPRRPSSRPAASLARRGRPAPPRRRREILPGVTLEHGSRAAP